MFRILAAKYILEHRYKFFDKSLLGEQYVYPETKTVTVGEVKDLAVWAKKQGMNYATVRRLNEWIRSRSLPKGNRDIEILK